MSLLKFFFTEKCSNCGERIEKAAQFCRHCGAGRANSWRKCNTCGVSVAADSQFCWSCKANVAAQPRDEIYSDRWRRTPGVFAMRVTIETPQDRLRNGIQVDEGTLGALYSNGVMKSKLDAGYHPQTSFWDRLLDGGKSGGFVEAIIAVADPVSSFVSLGGTAALFTKDFAAVEAAVLVTVQMADLGLFTRRMLPAGSDLVRDDDLMLPHSARVAEILRRHLSKLGVAEVARSTELRHEIEAALGAELPGLLEDYGLRFRGVEDVRVDSPEISRVREAEGGLTQTKRELDWSKKKRELETEHKLGEIKDEFAFKEQLDRWTHEYTLTSMEREHIIGMRRIQLGEAERTAAMHAEGRVRGIEKDYEIDIKRKDRDWEDEEDKRDLVMLDEMRKRQFEAMEKMQKLKLERLSAEMRNMVDLGQGLKDVPSPIAAGVLPPTQGNQVIRALEMLRPLPDVVVISSSTHSYGPGYGMPQPPPPSYMPSYMPQPSPAPGYSGMNSGGRSLEMLAQRYLPGVGVVVAGVETGNPVPMGTAWIAAGRGVVVTNAHVAEGVNEAQTEAGMSAWVIFSGQTEPCKVRRVLMHPEYAQSEAKGYPLPSYDVAVLELETPPPHAGLPIAGRSKLFALRELQAVAYLGFPMEHLAGGGTNLERPKAIAKKGVISSLEDWHMRHSDDPAQRMLIKHDLGVAGGASGSPMFDEEGDVVGIISAGNMEQMYDPQSKRMRRTPNGVVLNFAQRIDVLLGWMGW
ncbi:trypsin-like peptidase domain-containing protein [Prosthecobacter sp.]|uniref:trypsin-like peptidase domain-containing protein n=1 Tax=Prosthecobacter sp. TaxID=1965333 RepID=UPI003784BC1A